jgi:hypothetical protein
MLVFLIPVIILAGATSVGIAAEIAQSKSPTTPAAAPAKTESRPAPPAPPQRVP